MMVIYGLEHIVQVNNSLFDFLVESLLHGFKFTENHLLNNLRENCWYKLKINLKVLG